MSSFRLRLRNAAQIATICENGEKMKIREAMKDISVVENGTLIIGHDGLIADIGPASDLAVKYSGALFDEDVDVSGKVILPGFVDAHTHPIWAGNRVHEFALKLAGVPYMEIHKKGGGIGYTVKHTQQASEDELSALLRRRLDRMLSFGTTLVEAKSGYGLDLETEEKMLRVAHKMEHPIRMITTYLGAHSVPKGATAEEQTRAVCDTFIPHLEQEMKKKNLSPSFIDVFCEEGVFSADQSRRILLAGAKLGLKANFHGDELHPMGGGELCREVCAVAMSHCEQISEEGMKAMAEQKSVAVILPSTSHLLRIPHAPVRELIDAGVPVALATDFNPNAHCLSMGWVVHNACVQLRMTAAEALNGATINAAASLEQSHMYGSLEKGKQGDCVLLNAPQWEHMMYEFEPSIQAVVIAGKRVHGTF